MNNMANLDPIIRKVDGRATAQSGEEALITIDSDSGAAIQKTFLVRVGGNYQDYLVANNKNPTRKASGKSSYFVRDAQTERTLAIDIAFDASCPEGQEAKVAGALHGMQAPGTVLAGLLQRWLHEFIPSGDEGKFINTYDLARQQLEGHIAARAQSQTGLELRPIVSLTRQSSVAREIVVGPIEIGIRLHLYPKEQKMTVEAGLELDTDNYVKAFVFREGQESAEELFKRKLKEYFFQNISFDQFTRDLQYPRFSQPILASLSTALKEVGRRVRFINMSTTDGSNVPPPRELVPVTYNYQYLIHGRTQPVVIQNTVQLYCEDSVAFLASGVTNLETWVRDSLDVVLRRHLIGNSYVDLLLRFGPVVQEIKREMSVRAASIGYRVDHLVSIPSLTEIDLTKPFLIEAEDTFETKLDGFEVQLKFTIKLRIPKLESVEKYINPGTSVKDAIKEMVLNEARLCLREVHPERFYLYFNHPNEAASADAGDDRLAVKDLLAKKIGDGLRREFKPEILDFTQRVGRSDLTERYHNLCNVVRPFRVSIESPDPQATESLALTGNFVLRGVHPDSAGWNRFSVLRLDLDGLQDQLETHLRAELKTFYQSGFMFQNRMGRQQVFSVVKNYAGMFMREEFGLIIHLTNLDRNTTLAEENQRRLLIDLENNKLAALVDQSEHLVDRLKELRRQRVQLLSVSPNDKETLRELDESIEVLDAELKTISTARFGQHRLAAALDAQVPDELPPANHEEQVTSPSELESASKGQLTG
jgi:hypothetical protein